MSKKTDKKNDQGMKVIVIGALIIIPISSYLITYLFFHYMLQIDSFTQAMSKAGAVPLIITFALYAIVFSFLAKSFMFTKPKKTETLGKQSWKTVEDKKNSMILKLPISI